MTPAYLLSCIDHAPGRNLLTISYAPTTGHLNSMGHVNRNAATQPLATPLLSWQEAMAILEGCDERGVPIPFAIAFCTADESRHNGGQIIRYDKAVWHVRRVQHSAAFERVGGKSTGPKPARSEATRWTRLIRGVGTDEPRQIHLHLILEINGQPVR